MTCAAKIHSSLLLPTRPRAATIRRVVPSSSSSSPSSSRRNAAPPILLLWERLSCPHTPASSTLLHCTDQDSGE
ncbi:hypothetical protein PR202_gn00353 [Eleusine coracana subsp. coracana]|uniref:Uncharacterized protein n=1 Tax=Eleusine coracana subsp. coracana TaxID=191504 RepID=A0AAV5G1R4_ELECO|nr:hypothetical protein PR202_gn00353 [Eleusine coracana subsp. coracana]